MLSRIAVPFLMLDNIGKVFRLSILGLGLYDSRGLGIMELKCRSKLVN